MSKHIAYFEEISTPPRGLFTLKRWVVHIPETIYIVRNPSYVVITLEEIFPEATLYLGIEKCFMRFHTKNKLIVVIPSQWGDK